MKLEYIGPKAIISPQGISFKTGKDDKYIYLNFAMQIYKALNHEYEKNKVYHHNIEETKYEANEIENVLKQERPAILDIMKEELNKYNLSLDEEIQNVQNDATLRQEEITALKNNLIIMKPYRRQRFQNKVAYEHLIEIISDEVIRNKLQEVNAPFNEQAWHILQTLQGTLLSQHNIKSNLDTVTKDDLIFVVLKMENMY
jgi:hypothetical protein